MNRQAWFALAIFLLLLLVAAFAAWRPSTPEQPPADLTNLSPAEAEQLMIDSVRENDRETIEKLLAQGVDINMRNPLGVTPLWQACWSRHQELARWLLAQGADPSAHDSEHHLSPIQIARAPDLLTELVAAGSTDAAAELRQSALDGSRERLEAILNGRHFTVEELSLAKAHADLGGHRELSERLQQVAKTPLTTPIQLTDEQLQQFVGEYSGFGMRLRFHIRDRQLCVDPGTHPTQSLIAGTPTRFYFGSASYTFVPEGDGMTVQTSYEGRVLATHRR